MKNRISLFKIVIGCVTLVILFASLQFWTSGPKEPDDFLVAYAKNRSFSIEVHTTGEIDAGRSTTIASSLRGDLSKLIELIPDGTPVKQGETLAKIDSTPFEEKIQEIGTKIQDQELKVKAFSQACEREKAQVLYERESIDFEIESCQLDLDKIKNGEGPYEISRLKSQMLKAKAKYEELLSYKTELEQLIKGSHFSPGELAQCHKEIEQEKENYLSAELSYDNYIQFVYPSLVKKAEVNLKKTLAKKREMEHAGAYRVASAEIVLDQARQSLAHFKAQHQAAVKELAQTVITSPSPGIVVHRMEFRGGDKRKPQLGDMLMKNQPLFEIPDLSAMIVRTKLRELDLHKVDIGKQASVEVDAFPGKVFSGKISYLGTLAQTDHSNGSKEKAFEVIVQLTDKDARLRPGMTARVTIHSDNIREKLTIPSHAVFVDKDKFFCYLHTPQGCVQKEIRIIPANEQWALVSSGLTEGDRVLLTPPL